MHVAVLTAPFLGTDSSLFVPQDLADFAPESTEIAHIGCLYDKSKCASECLSIHICVCEFFLKFWLCEGRMFVQQVVFKPSSEVLLVVMDVSGLPPARPPAHVEVSHYPLPLSLSRATHKSIGHRFTAKKTAFFIFFFCLRSRACGLVWVAARPATTSCLLLEAELSVCFHCVVGFGSWGVPWSTFEWGL